MADETPPSIVEANESALDLDEVETDPSLYSPSNTFSRRRRTDLDGIFTGDVIQACFSGEKVAVEEENAMLVGEVAECIFGLIVDPEDKIVVDGHVLQVNPVQASMSGRWSPDAIDRMGGLSKQHRGEVWNAYKDPHEGNSSKWIPERDHRQH